MAGPCWALVLLVAGAAADPAPPRPSSSLYAPSARIAGLPYRFYVAHRGAGAYVAPENTREALSIGAAEPRADLLEFDVRVLADGTGAVWHDATVDRLTTSHGPVGRLTRAAFERLTVDASRWFGGGVRDTHPIVLDDVLNEFGGRRLLLAHPKDTAAAELVIREVIRRGLQDSVLVQTFDLGDARRVRAAGLHAQLLVGDPGQAPPARVAGEGIRRVSLDDRLPDETIRAYVAAGLTVSVWNVDRQYRRARLTRIGVRGIDSDDPTYVGGDTARYRRDHDPFARQTWWYGQIGQDQSPTHLGAAARGRFEPPDRWRVDAGTGPLFVLQGWASPLRSPASYALGLTLRFERPGAGGAGVYFSAVRDNAYRGVDDPLNGGYEAVLLEDGTLVLKRRDPGRTVTLAARRTPPPRAEEPVRLTITVTGPTVTLTRGGETISVRDAAYRGGYLFLGRQAAPGRTGPAVAFGHVTVAPVEPAEASRHGGRRAGWSGSPSSASRR